MPLGEWSALTASSEARRDETRGRGRAPFRYEVPWPQRHVLIAGDQDPDQSAGRAANSGASQSPGDGADPCAHAGSLHHGAAVSGLALALDFALVSRRPRVKVARYAVRQNQRVEPDV